MVGFTPEKERNLTPIDYGIAGAVSGAVTRALVQPLDVLKIRFQLQVEPVKRTVTDGKYHSVLQGFKTIYQEEGASALWKGHVPAQILSVLYGVVQFTTFEYLTKHAYSSLPSQMKTEKAKPVYHFFCGGLAGSAATLVVQPMDVLRTRLIAQGEPKTYTGTTQAIRLMYKEAGLRTFYKGLLPTLLQLFPYAGFQFGFYALFNSMWKYTIPKPKVDKQVTGRHKTVISQAFVCGALSGLCAKAAIYPLDMLKKRLQVQGFEEARKSFGKVQHYNGLRHCVVAVIREEGVVGFYKGLAPSLLKAVSAAAIIFTSYEITCDILDASKS
ncbi:mitochondrial thiamine pyrophosphate carrier-like [Amphiura filiformis]|uniref:mitochondrial thiamine pyrophosphate carrier-like n=1 Tax=Amphiura filiformis TaxID=82378 RepID=UPI003B2241C4